MGALNRDAAGRIPQRIGRYEIERLEAEGGMGEVFIAFDPLVKRRVAVKLLKRVLCDEPETRYRFIQEAEAVAGLEHPAIVPIYDFGEHDEQLYFVMRYVAGGTLKSRLVDGPLPPREVAKVVARMAEALEAAHARNLVHRDVKPANILFDPDGTSYLSDFGIVKSDKAVDETDTGALLLGTPAYISPEQAMCNPLDGRSDVYSLGVVAYHALTGTPPFKGKAPMAVAMAHVMEQPPLIRTRAANLPKITDDVFTRVLAKDPGHRYQTPGAFAKDLRDIASGRWYMIKISSNLPTPIPKTMPDPDPPVRTGDTGEFFAVGTPFKPATRRPKKKP
jgi:serine/threonine-protein kinase